MSRVERYTTGQSVKSNASYSSASSSDTGPQTPCSSAGSTAASQSSTPPQQWRWPALEASLDLQPLAEEPAADDEGKKRSALRREAWETLKEMEALMKSRKAELSNLKEMAEQAGTVEADPHKRAELAARLDRFVGKTEKICGRLGDAKQQAAARGGYAACPPPSFQRGMVFSPRQQRTTLPQQQQQKREPSMDSNASALSDDEENVVADPRRGSRQSKAPAAFAAPRSFQSPTCASGTRRASAGPGSRCGPPRVQQPCGMPQRRHSLGSRRPTGQDRPAPLTAQERGLWK
eukprot:TRINITY_DN101280_c0_g1_i1.p2 TRINITY_DN101280_c0_g1~~TRINITY_DN101280_c0_g1_i1.p2  ORF type:complete len:291 (-),score=67.22 TRINITY_DN101280_c0_g1_i1:271-1143(-)